MSRRSSDVVYMLLRVGTLIKCEFIPAEQWVVFRFRELVQNETVAIAVDLLELDRLVQLFQGAQADAKALGFLADAITRTITTPDGFGAGRPSRSARGVRPDANP
ncbi:MAG: hypothetical protein ACRDTC_24640 [Pseudonocardiaceae bacterium]